jgi:hypothetical protein
MRAFPVEAHGETMVTVALVAATLFACTGSVYFVASAYPIIQGIRQRRALNNKRKTTSPITGSGYGGA